MKMDLRFGFTRSYRLFALGLMHPVSIRAQTSDLQVFEHIYLNGEYDFLKPLGCVKHIVDCGANVGLSAAWFLSTFPDCSCFCVEPAIDNFEMLEKNIEPYGNRAEGCLGGVWSQSTRLRIASSAYRDGKEWAYQVEEDFGSGDACIEAFDMDSILKRSQFERISLLKMDIEGAEAVVFSRCIDSWIGRVDNVVMEIHDDSVFGVASELVFTRLKNAGFSHVSKHGELTFFRRS